MALRMKSPIITHRVLRSCFSSSGRACHVMHRWYTSSTSKSASAPPSPLPALISAKEISDEFLRRASKLGSVKRSQTLDPNQLQKLTQTLNRPNLQPNLSVITSGPSTGTLVPPGYHLVYFTPSALEQDLGIDGTDRTFNPESPFTRRLWAGGELSWVKDNPLMVGDEVEETTRLLSSEAKMTRDGEAMIVVGVEKVFSNGKGTALVDKRNWLFRKEIDPSTALQPQMTVKKTTSAPLKVAESRIFNQTPVSLFRFSALTFNAHKIHYSLPWCQNVEGHRNLVVHGPLNLINMLDLWRDSCRDGGLEGILPKSIKYRATSPIYAGEHYQAILDRERSDGEGKTTKIELWGADGKLGMYGEIKNF